MSGARATADQVPAQSMDCARSRAGPSGRTARSDVAARGVENEKKDMYIAVVFANTECPISYLSLIRARGPRPGAALHSNGIVVHYFT